MSFKIAFFFISLLLLNPVFSQKNSISSEFIYIHSTVKNNDSIPEKVPFLKDRIIPAAFVLLTGPLGGHRIILGTGPVVPVVYAVTLGGGLGILPVIDFFAILFSQNNSKFKNNKKIIMWLE